MWSTLRRKHLHAQARKMAFNVYQWIKSQNEDQCTREIKEKVPRATGVSLISNMWSTLRRKHLHAQARKMAFNVYQWIKSQNEDQCTKEIKEKVSRATGVSVRTIERIIKKGSTSPEAETDKRFKKETIPEKVNVRQEEEHPAKPIIELEEAAATRIAQENDAMRMCLKEETVLEKMGSTSLQFPDPQEKNLIESRQNGTDLEQTTPLKKSISVSLQDNEKPSTSKQNLIPTPFKCVLLWPEPKHSLQSKRRKKLPAVVTSPLLQKERNEKN
ncbi:hypothetical protein FQA39_LY15492 [Lamprigera yunnana]|nr:hypothetical protein FQA39_LY15492 [Lamprigera yunnana]